LKKLNESHGQRRRQHNLTCSIKEQHQEAKTTMAMKITKDKEKE